MYKKDLFSIHVADDLYRKARYFIYIILNLPIFPLNFSLQEDIFEITTAATRLLRMRFRVRGSVPWRLFFFIGVCHAF
jgi:hypothetical protein